jgi:hypothetical protein
MEETTQQFEMPPELRKAPPRRIRRRSGAGAGCVIIFGRLFILPHTIIGIGLLCMIPLTFAKVFLGDVHQGRIVRTWTSSGDDSTNYHLGYEYDADGVHRSGDRTCSRSKYNAIGDPRRTQLPIDVYSLNVLGWHTREALLPGESRWKRVGFYLLMALFWNGVVSVFVYMLWIAPWRVKQLYRWGLAVPGRIISKRTSSSDDSTTCYLDYEFIQPKLGRIQEKQSVSSERFAAANEGQLVTVLCHPRKRSPALIYEFGDFECL